MGNERQIRVSDQSSTLHMEKKGSRRGRWGGRDGGTEGKREEGTRKERSGNKVKTVRNRGQLDEGLFASNCKLT